VASGPEEPSGDNNHAIQMSDTATSLEQRRLEIIVLATGVLILVLVLALLLFVCFSLKNSHLPPSRDRATTWGGSWNERWDARPPEQYQDENPFENVRRRGMSVAENMRRGSQFESVFLQ
jgi:hypothetical protein